MRPGAPRGGLLGGLALIVVLCSGCRGLPKGAPPPPEVRVGSAGGEAPNRVSAAVLQMREAAFQDALARAGAGLRVAGRREDLVLRYAVLDEESEGLFTETFGIPQGSFSAPVPFGPADEVTVDALGGARMEGFQLFARPRTGGGGFEGFEIGVVVRPADGTLYPVIRGFVPLARTGTLLVTGGAPGLRPFATLLRLGIGGTARVPRRPPPRTHQLVCRSFGISSPALSRVLSELGLPERGGAGGLAVYRLAADRTKAAEASLSREGEAGPTESRPLPAGGAAEIVFGAVTLRIGSDFALADFSYRTRVEIRDRPDETRVEETHGEEEQLLVIGWDAMSAGRSRAALLRLVPQ